MPPFGATERCVGDEDDVGEDADASAASAATRCRSRRYRRSTSRITWSSAASSPSSSWLARGGDEGRVLTRGEPCCLDADRRYGEAVTGLGAAPRACNRRFAAASAAASSASPSSSTRSPKPLSSPPRDGVASACAVRRAGKWMRLRRGMVRGAAPSSLSGSTSASNTMPRVPTGTGESTSSDRGPKPASRVPLPRRRPARRAEFTAKGDVGGRDPGVDTGVFSPPTTSSPSTSMSLPLSLSSRSSTWMPLSSRSDVEPL